jgi:hypothetical protein
VKKISSKSRLRGAIINNHAFLRGFGCFLLFPALKSHLGGHPEFGFSGRPSCFAHGTACTSTSRPASVTHSYLEQWASPGIYISPSSSSCFSSRQHTAQVSTQAHCPQLIPLRTKGPFSCAGDVAAVGISQRPMEHGGTGRRPTTTEMVVFTQHGGHSAKYPWRL